MIGDDLAGVGGGIGAVDGGIAQGVPGILGIHIEGPFLNPARRGIHAEAKLRQLEDGLVDLLTAPQRGKTLVTLAPECATPARSEEHTSELQSLMRISYAVFCLKKKNKSSCALNKPTQTT